MKTRYFLTIWALTAVLLFPALARAGLYMEAVQTDKGDRSGTFTSKVYIDGKRMRVETRGAGLSQAMVFRGDQQVLWIIDDAKKTVTEFTARDIQETGRAMDDAMAQMRAQMAQMGPDERRMMEQMMKGQMPQGGGGPALHKTVWKKTETGARVGKWVCDRYVGMRGAEKVEEVCATDASGLGADMQAMEVTRQMTKFFAPLAKGANTGAGPGFFVEDAAVKGVPVHSVHFAGGVPASVTEVIAIGRQSVAGSLFNPPSGYAKEKPMTGMMSGH